MRGPPPSTIAGVPARVPRDRPGDVPPGRLSASRLPPSSQEAAGAAPSANPAHAPARPRSRRAAGVEANARLTATTAVVLLVLLAAEGVTILRVRALVTPHVVVGMLLVPPVALKLGSTGWRFARYYLGAPAYREKGPPPPLLRLLGPLVVVLTVAVLATGVALLLGPASWQGKLLLLHKASFVLWFGAMAIHVLGHLLDTARLAPRDWLRRARGEVAGAGLRQWAVAASLVVGVWLAALVVPHVGFWLAHDAPHVGG